MRVALPDSSLSAARRSLRAELAARRRAVSTDERVRAARRAALQADRALRLSAQQRIAVYAALPAELDAAPLIALARERGCRIFLPRIDRRRRSRGMRFVELGATLRENRLGIDEPEGSATIAARWLDLVFLPLLGFDRGGVRLGTGGGFYDRAFAFRQLRRVWHKPRLVGFGYAFQQVEHLTKAPHDVALDAVVTDEGFMRCATG
ncbi:MAG TPA: 5-formyltetrahydrofolate cyclo-ligase [Steroidobacteraceae bacterium]|nr:5-formyltetrahydrofolate cyclo-ligase [Steroidobacteraceae bacterium]